MHESDKSLSIEFSALDYALESQAQYSYRLKGFDDAWVTVPSNRNNATYTNLYPGNMFSSFDMLLMANTGLRIQRNWLS